jgi:plasmid maintenance system antidote protein VapI
VPATRLGALLGNGPQLWVDMQSKYDLQQAEAKLHDVLAQIHRITDDHATA